MGNICECLRPAQQSGPNVNTPLLANNVVSSSVNGRPKTARQYAPPKHTEKDLFSNYFEDVKVKTTTVSEVDKRFQDHEKLFNGILEERSMLDRCTSSFIEDLGGKTLQESFAKLKHNIGDLSLLELKRSKQCMTIEYLPSEIIPDCIQPLQNFNKANKLIKDILAKLPTVKGAVQEIVKDEDKLRRKLLLASLGKDGPEMLRNCMDNITVFRRLPEIIDAIESETKKKFESLVAAAKVLYDDN